MTHHWGYYTSDEGAGATDTRSHIPPQDKEVGRCPSCHRKTGGFMDDTIGECRDCCIKREHDERRAELEDEEFRKEQMYREKAPDRNAQEDSEGYAW